MVFEKVREIICDQLDVAEDDVTMESNIADDLGADSLDVVDLVMSLEEKRNFERISFFTGIPASSALTVNLNFSEFKSFIYRNFDFTFLQKS